MRHELATTIADVIQTSFGIKTTVELTRPDEQFGDYATNVALQLAKQLGQSPRAIAEALALKLRETLGEQVSDVQVAGPGFLNLTLPPASLRVLAQAIPAQSLADKTIVTEYSDPNPFKVLHAGHLYTSIVGDAIANLLEAAGGSVHRVNFGGDVGLHVAKSMWAILAKLGSEGSNGLTSVEPNSRADWLSARYVEGNDAYEADKTASAEIKDLNRRIYELVGASDHDSPLAQIYWICRQWSYNYFDEFYSRIGTKFEKYYPESETISAGLAAVNDHPEVFVVSDGATIFDGEAFGLHKRVFVTSQGLPTYETKDMGATLEKWSDYHFDRSIIITANDITEYMRVVLKAIEQFEPKIALATQHLTHGNVKLSGGIKMSSRRGNILRAVDVLDAASKASQDLRGNDDSRIVLAAVKYAFLKQRTGGDIIYDPAESVNLEGNSGPYLQYAHARACSILSKGPAPQGVTLKNDDELTAGERSLLRKIGEYAEVVDRAVAELMPHHVCTYLYELAQTFNRFYEHNRVIGDPREQSRVSLVKSYADTLQKGLSLLGIAAPDKM